MALVLPDRTRETSITTGTGALTLSGAPTGFQTFGAGVGDGNTTYYVIVNENGEWETGVGTYTAAGTTLSRDTVVSSSNAGAAVNFSAGQKDVFVSMIAGRAVVSVAGDTGVVTLEVGDITGLQTALDSANLIFDPVTVSIVSKTIVSREFVTVTGSGRTITLPNSPSAGDYVAISVLNFTDTVVDINGTRIMGLTENMTIDIPETTVILVYVDGPRGWRIV